MGIRRQARECALQIVFQLDGVEIAKRYGAEQSGAFVNGVLDGVARELGQLPGKGT